MWRVIKGIYRSTKSKIQLGIEQTDYFDIEAVVRQGCVLSPLLFSIFINKLAKKINESGIGIDIENKKVAVLMYADDIVILAKNPHELKKGLQIASEFGMKWRCKYNAKKTQVVIFGKNRKDKLEWQIGSSKIEQVDSYKYL